MEYLLRVVLLLMLASLQNTQGQTNTSSHATALKYLYNRPTEPIFIPKGPDGVVYDIPTDYLPERYQYLGSSLINRFGDDAEATINITSIELPDLSEIQKLDRQGFFTLAIPYHRSLAHILISIFLDAPTIEEFISVAVYCHDSVNVYLYIYALSIAIFNRNDTRGISLPSFAKVFPDKYFDSQIIGKVREEAQVILQPTARVPIEIPMDFTATDLDPEHLVAYFREDVGLNLAHWQWHLVYPFFGPMQIVDKNRRGELFYYYHEQIMARFNFERLSNGLARSERLLDLRAPIKEGYFPKLDSLVASHVWPGRPDYSTLRDINRESDQLQYDIDDLIRWRDRLYEAIHTGQVLNEQGEFEPLTEETGIDVLGNLAESSILSVNPNYYGDLHNLGHVALALTHDPDGRHLETIGVMGETGTAMRDPVFFRWHGTLNDIFVEYKNTLPRYTTQQLGLDGITITDVEVQLENGRQNLFSTFWQQDDVDLSWGLDFTPQGSVYARLTHLQHEPFTYRIQVENAGSVTMARVRIFLAPMLDEQGLPFLFRNHRLLMIAMDTFDVNLQAGSNVIERLSSESSVTMSFESTFRQLEQDQLSGEELEAFNFCGCGWPQYLLVPKGKPGGMPVQLFVMVSNYTESVVEQPAPEGCQDAPSYCGLPNRLYPEKRSMGYPFDRFPRDGVTYLSDFLLPNMFVRNMSIDFTDVTLPPFSWLNGSSTTPEP